ncbi:MAG: hypothetical protein HY746_08315 [Elusimicrobia bacterium]|nr:hypothetical protein [Elusimicrobiota bacterium]
MAKSTVPVYVSIGKNLNEYYLYADGGFDADWYIGYNNCWIVKLPPVPEGEFTKVYVGAKIGRAKIMSFPKSWDKNPIPGKIYIAVSQQPYFSAENTYFLVDSVELPLEPLPNDSLKGVDSSQWFWTEVSPSRISTKEPNYVAIWSSSQYFISSSSSPIIAGAHMDDEEENVWLNKLISGNAPSGENVLETPIRGIKPAVAVKLIPYNEYKVLIKGFSAEVDSENIFVSFSSIGEDIRGAWIELSYDKFDWQRITRMMFRPPYQFAFTRANMSADMFYLRAAAVDCLENVGYSKEILIPPLPPKIQKIE